MRCRPGAPRPPRPPAARRGRHRRAARAARARRHLGRAGLRREPRGRAGAVGRLRGRPTAGPIRTGRRGSSAWPRRRGGGAAGGAARVARRVAGHRPVRCTGSVPRSRRSRRRRPGAVPAGRCRQMRPTTAASSPRAWNAASASSSRPGGDAEQEAEAREARRATPRCPRPAAPAGRRGRLHPERAPLQQHGQRADQPGHADVLRRDGGAAAARASASSRTSSAHRRRAARTPGRTGSPGASRRRWPPPTTRLWPTSTRVTDSGARPTSPSPNAEIAGSPSWRVRWPPTIGTRKSRAGVAHPLERGPGGLLRRPRRCRRSQGLARPSRRGR